MNKLQIITIAFLISVSIFAFASVQVKAQSELNVSVSASSLDRGVRTSVLSATVSGGVPYLYQWMMEAPGQTIFSNIQDATEATYTFAPSSSATIGTYLFEITVTDVLAQTDTSSPVSVVVNAVPVVSVAPVGPVKMDVGQVQVFTAAASGGSGILSYQWYLDGSAVGSNSVSYSYTAGGASHSVTCKVTDSASSPVTSVASNAVSVTVSPALVASTVSVSPVTINQGQTSSLTSSSVATGTSPYMYQWLAKAPDGVFYLISGANSNSYSFITSIVTATGNWSFVLQVKDNAGVAVNSSEVSVIVNIPPLDHFVFTSISTQTAGTPFSITIIAKDASNNTLTNFVGTNTLNVSTGTISPISTSAFSNGVWAGSVTVTGANPGVTLFSTGSGMSGTSNSFTVTPSDLNRFTFSTISSPQTVGSAFSITVTAKDVYGNIVTDYVGTPSLTYSAGSINPGTISAFISGVGATSVTVTGTGSSVTITATDGSHTGNSGSFTVAIAPTPTPTPTPEPTSTSTPIPTSMPVTTPNPTKPPKATPTPTATPSPSPTPLETTVNATTDNGTTVDLVIRGNITSLQMSNVIISTNQSAMSTTVSFTLTGESGTTGFSIITIPKTVIFNGKTPIVFIDGQQATNQGFTQDSENFYVSYSTQFSIHDIKIEFDISPTTQTDSFGNIFAVGIIVPEIILAYTIIAIRRLRRKPEDI